MCCEYKVTQAKMLVWIGWNIFLCLPALMEVCLYWFWLLIAWHAVTYWLGGKCFFFFLHNTIWKYRILTNYLDLGAYLIYCFNLVMSLAMNLKHLFYCKNISQHRLRDKEKTNLHKIIPFLSLYEIFFTIELWNIHIIHLDGS